MSAAVSWIMNFVIVALCYAVSALSFTIYRGKGSKAFLFMGFYAVVQLMIELRMRGLETNTPVAQWLVTVFQDTLAVKSLLYGAAAFLLLLSLFQILGLKVTVRHLIAPCFVLIWLIGFSLLISRTMLHYSLYLLPYELYVVILSLTVLYKVKKLPHRSFFPLLKRMLIIITVLTVLAIVEDVLVSIDYGFSQDYNNPLNGVLAKERNYCECLLTILLLYVILRSGIKIIVGALGVEPAAALEELPENQKLSYERFAAEIGLSPREREVFSLLLGNKSLQEISDHLFVSQGTVKSHTHNIYRKANVSNREELIKKAVLFSDAEE